MFRIHALIRRTRAHVEALRDALAAVSAMSAVGQAEQVLAAAERLEAATRQAGADTQRMRRLMRHLDADSMPDAAVTLCGAGRRAEAREIMALHRMTQEVATAQAEVGLFVSECLSSLSTTRDAVARQSPGGRLIGSA